MVNAKNVQSLNDRIEKINNQRVKTETQHEMLTKRLNSELDSYKKQFGVDLVGKSFTETRKKINAEIKKVTSEVEAEFELKEKVVSAIDAGDIAEAYRLLGLEVKAEEDVSEETEGTEEIEEDTLSVESDELSLEEPDEEDFGGLTLEDTQESDEVSSTQAGDLTSDDKDDFDFDLEVEDPEEAEPKAEEPKKNTEIPMSSAKDAIGDLEVIDEDEPEELGSDFGFGDLMKGTKFNLGGE